MRGRWAGYDPWGKLLSIDTFGDLPGEDEWYLSTAEMNPLRYRGYYYDNETGFYYLQSRYYDPIVCRFINADSYASTGQGFVGCNMFAYCENNPANRKDTIGKASVGVLDEYEVVIVSVGAIYYTASVEWSFAINAKDEGYGMSINMEDGSFLISVLTPSNGILRYSGTVDNIGTESCPRISVSVSDGIWLSISVDQHGNPCFSCSSAISIDNSVSFKVTVSAHVKNASLYPELVKCVSATKNVAFVAGGATACYALVTALLGGNDNSFSRQTYCLQ